MDLVEENQKLPLAFTVVLTVIVVLTAEMFTRVLAVSVAQANQVYWMIDRSAGMVAYELLSLSVILGLSMTLRMWDKRGLRKWARQLHQYTTLLILPFIGLHLFGLLRDSSVPFTMSGLLVPLQSTYRPMLAALGTLSLYGVLVLIVSSYIQHKITVKAWRIIHFVAFPAFFAVTIHGFFIGTDSHTLAARYLYSIPVLIVMVQGLARYWNRGSQANSKAI